jgi:hypothetical protein
MRTGEERTRAERRLENKNNRWEQMKTKELEMDTDETGEDKIWGRQERIRGQVNKKG